MPQTFSKSCKLAGIFLFTLTLLFSTSMVAKAADDSATNASFNNLKLFWHDLSDNINLALTFDPIAKVDKALSYAEQRTSWAQNLADSDRPQDQALALKLSVKADDYMARVEARKEKLLQNINDKTTKLLERLAAHQENKLKVWDKLEAKVPADKLETFTSLRSQVEDNEKQFLEQVLNNDQVPALVKEKLSERKETLEQRELNRQNFMESNQELIDKLKNLHEENKEQLQETLQNHREELLQTQTKLQEQAQQKRKIMPLDKQDAPAVSNIQTQPVPRMASSTKVKNLPVNQAQPVPELERREIKQNYRQLIKDLGAVQSVQ